MLIGIVFFLATVFVPVGTEQFTIQLDAKSSVTWSKQVDGSWRAVEPPHNDGGVWKIEGTKVTLTGEGHSIPLNVAGLVKIPEKVDWTSIGEVMLVQESMGSPIIVQRDINTVTLSQKDGKLVKDRVIISWKSKGS
jgi:hypothetical protein